jgi:hypothetical protein
MKKILLVLLSLTFMATASAQDRNQVSGDIVCQVKLIDINTNEVLNEREIRQATSGMISGSIAGSDFYIESVKRRFLRKPIPNSVISFGRAQNGWDNSTIVQFWRKSNPNRYGILTQSENIGPELKVFPNEKVQEKLGEEYLANIECSLQESQYTF